MGSIVCAIVKTAHQEVCGKHITLLNVCLNQCTCLIVYTFSKKNYCHKVRLSVWEKVTA